MSHYGLIGLLSSGKYLRPATRAFSHVTAFGRIYPNNFSHDCTNFLEEDLRSGIKIESAIGGGYGSPGRIHGACAVSR